MITLVVCSGRNVIVYSVHYIVLHYITYICYLPFLTNIKRNIIWMNIQCTIFRIEVDPEAKYCLIVLFD